MKKFITVILILTTTFLLYFLGKILPDIYFNIGQKAYNESNYKNAYYNLKTAMLFNHKNAAIRRYYAKTLLHLSPTLEVQKELYKISQGQLHDSAELIADIRISKWKNRILSNIGTNYIDQVPFNDQILRWDEKKFPITVFIQNKSTFAPPYYVTEIQRAFLQWQRTSNFIQFKFIDNEKAANINVQINPSSEMKKCTEDDCKYSVAYTTPLISDNLLKKMNIFFYDSNNRNKPFNEKEIYNTAIHEIGHALGIMGHSYNPSDIMYMETNPNKLNYTDYDFQPISPADLNTLRLLYKLIPDITNTRLDEFDTKKQFFASIVMGNEKQINSKKTIEALNYIRMAPNLPNGYIDLAVAYSGENQYRKAIDFLNKALSLSSNDSDRFIIYYNFSIIYMEIKDWEISLRYAEMAKQIDPTAEVEGLIATIYNNQGNNESAKKTYAEAIQMEPKNIDYSVDLARIYFREFNFAKSGKIVKSLIKVNPEAKNDSKVKRYLIFTYFAPNN